MDLDEVQDLFDTINSSLGTNYFLSINVSYIFSHDDFGNYGPEYYLAIHKQSENTENTELLKVIDKKIKGSYCFEGYGKTLNKAFNSLKKDIDLSLKIIKKRKLKVS
jgi:hypothetical protein